MVVGDPNQCIYTWRQAERGNLRHLQAAMAVECCRIALTQSFRSTGHVLQCANAALAAPLSMGGETRLPADPHAAAAPTRLWTANEKGARVQVRSRARVGPIQDATAASLCALGGPTALVQRSRADPYPSSLPTPHSPLLLAPHSSPSHPTPPPHTPLLLPPHSSSLRGARRTGASLRGGGGRGRRDRVAPTAAAACRAGRRAGRRAHRGTRRRASVGVGGGPRSPAAIRRGGARSDQGAAAADRESAQASRRALQAEKRRRRRRWRGAVGGRCWRKGRWCSGAADDARRFGTAVAAV